jgi:ubiquinone biosynthesis protein UbiJ
MLLEDQRFIHEDLERLEQAVAERVAEEPRTVSLALHIPDDSTMM